MGWVASFMPWLLYPWFTMNRDWVHQRVSFGHLVGGGYKFFLHSFQHHWLNNYFNIYIVTLKHVRYLWNFFFCGAATQCGSWPTHSWGFLDHTRRRTTVGRTPLDKWSARRRDLYLTTHNTHNRQTSMPPGGIRTHDLSRRAAADLRLRPRGHRDRDYNIIILWDHLHNFSPLLTKTSLWGAWLYSWPTALFCLNYLLFNTLLGTCGQV